ncbi:hypothetical protein EJ04DRAFT_517272 [Polyplosphaeria fusca]|uniref:Uncharacterized protein n=1 Tax=Polyplosphaeria fusca TaxID=682080 RepID=A0A9P4QJE2_9PLEO|nr:hypothetical protein EJ04DRAFT_517272 [Polyplosphaeria fusca]
MASRTPLAIDGNDDAVHAQTQSPLFSAIPAEIRNEIFDLALREYQDPEKPYNRYTYYTRPGSFAQTRVDFALLQTCKRIFKETMPIPLKNLEARFYLGIHSERVPPDYAYQREYPDEAGFQICSKKRKQELSSKQWAAIQHINITAQLIALRESCIRQLFADRSGLAPKVVTITIRYTDWWYWENNHPLNLSGVHMRGISFPNSVERIVMQLETREGKRKELEQVIADLFARPEVNKYSVTDGRDLMLSEEIGVKEWQWDGPTVFAKAAKRRSNKYPHHPEGLEMRYIVKELTWI